MIRLKSLSWPSKQLLWSLMWWSRWTLSLNCSNFCSWIILRTFPCESHFLSYFLRDLVNQHFFFYSNLLTVFKYTVCQTSKHSNLTLITNISTYSQFKLTWNKTLLSVLVNIIWHLVTCSSAFYETLQTNFQTNFVLFYSPYLDLQITKLIREREEGLTGNCTILLFCGLFSERPEIITVQFQQQP